MRRCIFRFLAVTLGIAFIWVICAGGMNHMSLYERIMSFGLAIVFLLYGLIGERPADYVLALLSGSPVPPSESSLSDDDDTVAVRDEH